MNIVQNIDVSLNIPSSYSPRNYNYANLTHVFSWSSSNIINVFNITTGLSSIITLPSTSSITDPSYNGILKIKNILSMDNELLWIEYISNDLTECIITYYTINQIYTQIYKTSTQSTICKSCIDANNYWICDVSSNSLYKYNYSTGARINTYSIATSGVTSLFSNVNYGGNYIFINYGKNIRRFNITTGLLVGDIKNPSGTIIGVGVYQLWYGITSSWSIINWNPNSRLNIPGSIICNNGSYVWSLSGYNLFMYNTITAELTNTSLVSDILITPILCDNATITGGFAFLPIANSLTGSPVSLYKIIFPS